MNASFIRFFTPETYHPDAVASARSGGVTEIESHFLIVRLAIAIHDGNQVDAKAVLQRLDGEQRGGHDLFLIKTAHLIIAIEDGAAQSVRTALDDWLTARQLSPQNFVDQVLDAPELASIITAADRMAVQPIPPSSPNITQADRDLVANFDAAREQAITENLEWLRQMNVEGSVQAIAETYQMTHANHQLREVTISSSNDWPDIIIAVDSAGRMLGSFLSH